MEHDLTENPARAVRTRFELAIGRMIETWLSAGRVEVSPADVALAREFLVHAGCTVEDAPEARLRIVNREGLCEEMTREAAVMVALRHLATRRS